MELPTYFSRFLHNIRLTDRERQASQAAHTELRGRLMKDDKLAKSIVTAFLQGSYRRSTALRASPGHHSDVDVVVVTKLSRDNTPTQALNYFKTFLREHYHGKWRTNERSLRLVINDIELDLVVTSAPALKDEAILIGQDRTDGTVESEKRSSVAAEALWQLEPLWIPDRQLDQWQQTHPLAQLAWTLDKNRKTDGHYVNVVKAIKWWRRVASSMPKHPRGYPLERLVGECCPDRLTHVATGVVQTLEAIVSKYTRTAQSGQIPQLLNHGIQRQNVFARVPPADFRSFIEHAQGAARLARRAFDSQDATESAGLWRQLFGEQFPLVAS